MNERVGRCDSVEGGIRCRGLKGHLSPHWGARNPGDSLIGVKKLYGMRLTPQARTVFWVERPDRVIPRYQAKS